MAAMECPRYGKTYKDGFTCTPTICSYKTYAVAGIAHSIHKMRPPASRQDFTRPTEKVAG